LVVLSSCATAVGAVLTGEGVLGLGAAFLAAGTPTLIASQWPVGDRTTARLVRAFYREMAAGATASAALRRAQLEIRSDARTRHSAYWAGFVLIGEPGMRVTLTARSQALTLAWMAAAAIGLAWILLRWRSRGRV
jgi:CHAT domain-containing protein